MRSEYFWPSAEFSDRVLFSIAHDIPKAGNPLWPADPHEVFPGDGVVQNDEENDEEESDESFDAALGKKGLKRKKRKKRVVMTAPKCVEWLGLVNSINGFAAIKVSMPGEYIAL